MNINTNQPLVNIYDPFNHRVPPRVTTEHLAGPIPAFLYTLDTGSNQHQPPVKPTFYASIVKPFVVDVISTCRALPRKIVAKTRRLVSRR